MKNTKERILEAALILFNTRGLSKITLRAIAKEMGISQGNLNYHFKKRADIIEALYFQLVKNIDKSMAEIQSQKLSLQLMFDLQKFIMMNFYAYRFFLLDFVQIIREHQAIKTHYLKLSKQRESQFMALITILIDKKILRAEELPNEYRSLYIRFQIMGEFWISSATLINEHLTESAINDYYGIIIQSIYPYLTETGKRVY